MRVLLDSSIFVRAFCNEGGSAYRIVFEIVASGHTLILCHEILHEVARVLRSQRMLRAHCRSEEAVYNYIGLLMEAAEMVQTDPLIHAPIRDPKDIFVLQTALAGDIDVLCSSDRDFFEPPALLFLQSHGIAALTDVEMIKRLNAE